MLTFINFKKKYGSREILSITDFRIPFQLSRIKGINGSGKTTLLKSIAGVIPFSGDIHYNDINLKKDPIAYRRLVTYSEAEPEYPNFLTGEELIGFVARARKYSLVDAYRLIDYFVMKSYISQPCGGYSAGMLKKVSLCIAFLGNPRLILLDEPFAFIDQDTEDLLLSLIKNKRNQKTQIILTSHHDLKYDNFSMDAEYLIKNQSISKIL